MPHHLQTDRMLVYTLLADTTCVISRTAAPRWCASRGRTPSTTGRLLPPGHRWSASRPDSGRIWRPGGRRWRRPGREADQPTGNRQAHYVRSSRLPTPAQPHPPCSMSTGLMQRAGEENFIRPLHETASASESHTNPAPYPSPVQFRRIVRIR